MVVVSIVLGGCDGLFGIGDGHDATGTWSGDIQGSSVATVVITLTEVDKVITGSGTISRNNSFQINVTGRRRGEDDVTLTFSAQGFNNAVFTGKQDDARITGSVNGSGYNNDALSLRRR